MTRKSMLEFVIVCCVNCVIILQCIQEGNCDSTSHNGKEHYLDEILTYTAKTVDKPVALSMIVEDDSMEHKVFQPTIPPTTQSTSIATTISINDTTTDEPKGRALNFTPAEHNHENGLSSNVSTFDMFGDLSDVSMDEDEASLSPNAKILSPKIVDTKNKTLVTGICERGGLTYENGEKLENGCDSICTCLNGKMDCTDRCSGPFFRKGKKIDDPLCSEKQTEDPCCSILVCAADTETEPLEICHYKNKTYHRGDKIENGCEELCSCETGGKVTCKKRCTSIDKASDRCVLIPDPKDPCCKTMLCDVTLDDLDHEKEAEDVPKLKIISAKYLNETTIKIKFDGDANNSIPTIEISKDKMVWEPQKVVNNNFIKVGKSGILYVRLEHSDELIPVQNFKSEKKPEKQAKPDGGCEYKGSSYKIGDEFHDECISFCVCRETGVKCLKIECPTYFGVDVLDPTCIKWDTVPSNFTPIAPNCCPKKLTCTNNGSCEHKGETYQNWQQLPENITGCEKRCYCEMGKIECQNVCPPVPALPPPNLPCPTHHASLGHSHEDECCLYWMCNEEEPLNGKAQSNTMEHESNKFTINNSSEHLGPFATIPTKKPSKVLGPLLVYANEENVTKETQPSNHPNITLEENHYFNNKELPLVPTVPPTTTDAFNKDGISPHKDVTSFVKDGNKDIRKPSMGKKPVKDDSDIHEDSPHYIGPINPDFKSPSIPNKSNVGNKAGKTPDKIKPPKNGGMFVTPSPTIYENYIPEYQHHQVPFTHAEDYPIPPNKHKVQKPQQNTHQVHIHGKGNPEDILQILNQHPELANYSPGSVLEIHDVLPSPIQRPQFVNPNTISNHNVRPALGPYVINQDHQGNLPPGIHLEHILQEIHKNNPASNSFIPFPTHPQAYPAQHDGQIFVAQPNGPIFNTRPQHNVSQPGIGPNNFPQGYPNIQSYNQPQEIIVHNREALDAHTIRLAFTVPPVIVGLHGRVEVRYTNKPSDDTNTWKLQVFAPPDDLITTPQLEFDLIDLEPDTEYRVKIAIILRDLRHSTSTSRVYSIRTLKSTLTTTLPPMINIEPDLIITEINASWVNIAWRKFTDSELQFIDGVQLRFREIDGKVYAATPLIHRAVTNYLLENLKPTTKYEIGIFFIPFPGQTTELHAEHMIHFTTANEIDSYGFNVTLDISHIKPTSVEISWAGVPYPEDKYVNIYRAIYQSDSGKGDSSTFKVAKRDSPPKSVIMDLKPGTRYRLWLEVYLTNGKIKTSNVQDFLTKPRSLPSLGASSKSDKLEGELPDDKENYYGPLVVVAILAAIAIMCTLVLLLMLVRRHSQNKAAITTPPQRVSQSAYDNPTYKVEIQQETMNL